MILPRHFAVVDSRVSIALAFSLPFAFRLLPELLMGPFLVGFDTVGYYIPVVLTWIRGGSSFLQIMAYAPLFYGLLVQLALFGVPLTVSLKILPPILHGLLGLAVYFCAKQVFHWPILKSLSVSFLATLYFVSLRISWDMLRSELGLIFLFVFLTFLHDGWEKKPWKAYTLLLPTMILVVLSNQLVTVILFVIFSAVVLQKLSRKEYAAVRDLVLTSLPGVLLFSFVIYAGFSVPPSFSAAGTNDWLSLFGFSSCPDMAIGTFGFVLFCYLPLLPFVLTGIRSLKSLELRVWVCWCLVGVLLGVAASFVSFPSSYRWTLLMVFPLVFFAVEGFKHFSFRRLRIVLIGAVVLLSFSFAFLPASFAFPYLGLYPNYVPSSMLQNSVSLDDCEDVVRALNWVSASLRSNDVLLVHDAFHGWALLYIEGGKVVCYGYENPETAAERITAYDRLFLIWWVPGEGLHGLATLPPSFVEVYRSGRIAVYEWEV